MINHLLKCALLVAWSPIVPAAGETGSPAAGQDLVREVMELRLEVYQQAVEFADWKILQIERHLDYLRGELRAAEEEERSVNDELATADSDGEVGARRAEMSGTELPRLRERRRTLELQIAGVNEVLTKEQQRRASLIAKVNPLKARLGMSGRP